MTGQADGWRFLAMPVAAAALLAVTAAVGGRTLTRALPLRGWFEQALIALPAGLLVLATAGLALGLCGKLTLGAVLATLGVLHLTGTASWRWLVEASRAVMAGVRRASPARVAAAVAVGAALAPIAALALYPPTGFDATMYHLPFAKAFAASGRLPFLPDLRVPVFPQLNEVLFALALLLGGDGAVQLLVFLATLLTAALLVQWGREAFPDAPGAGWLGAAALLGNPLVVYLGGSAYVDPMLALWVTASLYALHRYRAGAGAGWLVLSAAFVGAAAAGKYLGLFFVAALVAVVAAGGRPAVGRAAGRWRQAVAFALVALAVMAPWYARIVYYTGNPVFPFLPRIFGGSPWDPLVPRPAWLVAALSPSHWLPPPLAWDGRLLRRPWEIAVRWRRAAGGPPPLSPAYLVALPLVAVRAARDGRTRRLLLLVAVFAAATLPLPRDPRYLLPVVPAASLTLGVALAAWGPFSRLPFRRRMAVGCAALLFPGALYGGYRLARLGPLPTSQAAREALLARELPLYPAVRFLNLRSGSAYTAYGFGTENLHYLADGRLLGDWGGPASYQSMPSPQGDAEALYAALRRLGAEYLILPESPETAVRTGRPDFQRGFRLLYADPHSRVFAVEAPAAEVPGRAGGARPFLTLPCRGAGSRLARSECEKWRPDGAWPEWRRAHTMVHRRRWHVRRRGLFKEATTLAEGHEVPIERSALLVIDVQDSFKATPRWERRSSMAFEDNVDRIVRAYRTAGLPVVFFLHTDGDEGFSRSSRWFKLMDFLEPREDEPLLVKTTRNAFTSTNLQQLLEARGVRRLAIVGIQTEQCCETTARLAADLGYDVDFLIDATLTFPIADPATGGELSTDEILRRTEFVLRGRFARITEVDQLTGELERAAVASGSGGLGAAGGPGDAGGIGVSAGELTPGAGSKTPLS
jgi:nicotinamidase-related amidase